MSTGTLPRVYSTSTGELRIPDGNNLTGTFDPRVSTVAPGDLIKTDPAYLGDEFNAVIILVTIFLCAAGVILNLVIMTHFWPKIKNLIPFLYFILSSSDFVTAVCAGIHTIIFTTILAMKNSGFDSILWLILSSYFLTVVTFKVSAFVSMIFAVIRTINIASPFIRIKRKPAIAAILVWLLIWVTISSLQIGAFLKTANDYKVKVGIQQFSEYVLISHFYQPNSGKLIKNDLVTEVLFGKDSVLDMNYDDWFDQYEHRDLNNCLIGIAYAVSPVFLCALITLIATIIQVIYLLKPNNAATGITDPEGDMRAKKKISITIILIGVLFTVCSACTLYHPLVECFSDTGSGQLWGQGFYRRLYGSGYIPFFVNAALNPLILVLRVSNLRLYVWGMVAG